VKTENPTVCATAIVTCGNNDGAIIVYSPELNL
jgi:hypothetical protein